MAPIRTPVHTAATATPPLIFPNQADAVRAMVNLQEKGFSPNDFSITGKNVVPRPDTPNLNHTTSATDNLATTAVLLVVSIKTEEHRHMVTSTLKEYHPTQVSTVNLNS